MKLPIKDFAGYFVDEDGNVWSNRADKGNRGMIKLKPQKGTRWKVSLVKNGKRYNRKIHLLVMRAFNGEAPNSSVVRHIDGDPRNNKLSNLLYGTHKENSQDMIAHGRSQRGEKSYNAKFNKWHVLRIRMMYEEMGNPISKIAAIFNSARCTIDAIVKRRNWKHI